jgi:mannitol operon transcriptional antiterminator
LILAVLSAWEFSLFRRYIGQIEDDLHVSLFDRDHLLIALYLAVMARRCRVGSYVDMPQSDYGSLVSPQDYQGVQRVCGRLFDELELEIHQAELVQLALEIATALSRSRSSQSPAQPAAAGAEPGVSMALIRSLVEEVAQRMGSPVVREEAIERLKEHLDRTVARLRGGLPVLNPLTDQVNLTYPYLWPAGQQVFARLEQALGLAIPREGTAFITMYLALILDISPRSREGRRPRVVLACPSGGVTATMLLARLKSELPELEIVATVSIRELGRIDARTADAIISTAVFRTPALPVITISPFVHPHEVLQIRAALGLKK